MKLVAIFKRPAEPEKFDHAYYQTHMPLMEKVPGLLDYEITRFNRSVMGDDLYLMNVMRFADKDSLKSAMRSPEMAAAGDNLNSFAGGLVSLLFAD